ncbi:protein DMR6-LIKE OXYGENASE 2-like [Vigna unguiculata]|uniref:Isopenicillin N synthase-like n=1 Tax=Vigna unguiculata TaxID=3917 RepID=A0A4D6NSV1_VIGUN|nr:protein DMR6-LIKE OXYGENASE 2-like [Vigna unguiculata]QCE15589.1 Isopenicillin N synthase-like [Vigna unguiculata]
MASAASIPSSSQPEPNIFSIKEFAKSNGDFSLIPSTYHSISQIHDDDDDVAEDLASSIPVIDFSHLTSHHPQTHAKAVHLLGEACAEWGVFMLTNHGIPENLVEKLMKKSREFHDLPIEEKNEYGDNKSPFQPIRHGTSFCPQVEQVHYWRDYLKATTFPQFNFPHKPPGYREVAYEYSQKIRGLARKLLEGISESLGLGSNSIVESTEFDSGHQLFVVNLYPPCPQPHLALGLPPHSDIGLLTLLTQNGIGGLQVKHHGKWVKVNPLLNSITVLLSDQLEVMSNGRYESVLHRAILNNEETRISVVLANGPALDKEIGPLAELLEKEKPLFESMKYQDYFQFQQRSRLNDKSRLDEIRLN